MEREVKQITYTIHLMNRHATEKAFHELKAIKEFTELINVMYTNGPIHSEFFSGKVPEIGAHCQFNCYRYEIVIDFNPEVEDKVKDVLMKYGAVFHNRHEETQVSQLEIFRSEKDSLFLKFAK